MLRGGEGKKDEKNQRATEKEGGSKGGKGKRGHVKEEGTYLKLHRAKQLGSKQETCERSGTETVRGSQTAVIIGRPRKPTGRGGERYRVIIISVRKML